MLFIYSMKDILGKRGFEKIEMILTETTKFKKVDGYIKHYVKRLKRNDIFIIYFPRHGIRRDDESLREDSYPTEVEAKEMDDCWLFV